MERNYSHHKLFRFSLSFCFGLTSCALRCGLAYRINIGRNPNGHTRASANCKGSGFEFALVECILDCAQGRNQPLKKKQSKGSRIRLSQPMADTHIPAQCWPTAGIMTTKYRRLFLAHVLSVDTGQFTIVNS